MEWYIEGGGIAIGIVVEARQGLQLRICAVTVTGVGRIIRWDDIVCLPDNPDGDGTKPTNSPVGIEILQRQGGLESLWRIAQIIIIIIASIGFCLLGQGFIDLRL